MATIQTGPIVSDIRGSVGALTYSRTHAGLIVKSRSNPPQPASAKRDAAQDALKTVTQAWSGTLTETERNTWKAYARNYPRPNRLGERVLDGGYLAFIRPNVRGALLASPLLWATAPSRAPLPVPFFSLSASYSAPTLTASIALGPTYPLEAGFLFIIFAGKTTNIGVGYYDTPWQGLLVSTWGGAAWSPSLSPLTLPAWSGAGEKLWMKGFILDSATGAMSSPGQASCNVVVIP